MRRRILFLAAVAASLAACGRETTTAPPLAIEGTVVLVGSVTNENGVVLGRKVIANADGVAVDLLFGASVVATTVTAGGHYSFPNLRTGAYIARARAAPAFSAQTQALTVSAGPVTADTLRLVSQGDLDPYPNPSTDTLTTTFFTNGTEPGSLKIYDQRGNLVRVLLEGTFEFGTNRMPWNGRDVHGSRVPPGYYWVTFEEFGTLTRIQLVIRQ